MRIAVTGATGFVGRELLKQANAAGHTTVPIVRRPSGLAGEVVAGELSPGRLPASQLARVDALVHLAARTHVLRDSAGDAEYARVNVEGTRAVLDAAITAGVRRFVFMSSVKAVGERSRPGEPLAPDTPPRPEDAYGRTKLAAEALVRERCDGAGLEWVILRPPLVYGPGVKANFARMVNAVGKGVPLPLKGLANSRSLVDVANLAQAALLACQAPGAAGRIFMVADATVSTSDLLRAIGRAANRPARLIAIPRWIIGAFAALTGKSAEFERLCGTLELDASATRSVLDWTPLRSFVEGIDATVASQLGRRAGQEKNAS